MVKDYCNKCVSHEDGKCLLNRAEFDDNDATGCKGFEIKRIKHETIDKRIERLKRDQMREYNEDRALLIRFLNTRNIPSAVDQAEVLSILIKLKNNIISIDTAIKMFWSLVTFRPNDYNVLWDVDWDVKLYSPCVCPLCGAVYRTEPFEANYEKGGES